jgi:DNA-binding transcriptional LysR family regulator
MIGFGSSATGNVIPLEFKVGEELRHLSPALALTVSSAETMIAAASIGLGLIQVPRYHVEPDLAAGTLIEVLPQFRPTPTPVSLLYPRSRQLSPRVRVFIDWVTHEFATRASSARGQ